MPDAFDPPLEAPELLKELSGLYASAERIFVGGQAAVFKTTDHAGQVHALKVYFPDPDAYIEERTDREVAALRRLRGDTLVLLEADGHVTIRGELCRYVATSFIAGQSVAAFLKTRNGPMPVGAVARLGADIAIAIGLLWSERIVHRDVTPNNLMLAQNGRAVLIDLGLARHTSLVTLSKPNEGWGTRGYLSPEQADAVRALTCKSDVFSLGVVLQECLAGVHPYGRDQRKLAVGGRPTSSIVADAPKDLCRVIDEMVRHAAPRRPSPSVTVRELRPFASSGSW
jgi:serine/threonine protein kinase